MMMLIAAEPRVMGPFAIERPLQILGWSAKAIMGLGVLAMLTGLAS